TAIRDGDARAAGLLYSQLLGIDSEQALPAKQQVDLGTYLMSDGQHRLAGAAFESLLAHYPTFEAKDHIELLLGVLYSRYLNNPVRARQYLEHALPQLRNPNDRELAERELAHVATMLGGQ
ncbi:MAG: hypothetical protein PHU85_19390, partial [Phycisphaerae bacterium]|nr:hypothetical protein [Phycisphaerae bacterium]